MEEEKDLTIIEQLVDDLCIATFGPEDGPESVRKDEQKQREIVKKLYHLMYPAELTFTPLNITPQMVIPMTYKAEMDVSYEMNTVGTIDFVKDSLASQLMNAVKDNMSIKCHDNPRTMTTTFEGRVDIVPGGFNP